MNSIGDKDMMENQKSVAEALAALPTSSSTRTKAGRLRELLPQIEVVHAAGVPHQTIVETLNEKGFDLTLKTYKAMLYRARQELAKGGKKAITSSVPVAVAKATTPAVLTPRNEEETGQADPEDLSQLTVKEKRERRADQFLKPEFTNPLLKNLKEKLAKRPGDPVNFDWEAERSKKIDW